jgi:hypothetical protein
VTTVTSAFESLGHPVWTFVVVRDGSQTTIEQYPTGTKGQHSKAYYDLAAHRLYTVDLGDSSCTLTAYTDAEPPSDFDPMRSTTMLDEIKKLKANLMGTESVAGMPAKIVEWKSTTPAGNGRAWISVEGSYLLKWVALPAGGAPKTMLEVKQINLGKPAPGFFNPPANCKTQGYTPAGRDRWSESDCDEAADYSTSVHRGLSAAGSRASDRNHHHRRSGQSLVPFRDRRHELPAGSGRHIGVQQRGHADRQPQFTYTQARDSGGGGGYLSAAMQDNVGNHGDPVHSANADYTINCK